jgi:hypothetical protein
MEGIVLGIWGEEFLGLIEDPLAWLVGGIIGLALFIPLAHWWFALAEPADNGE